MNIEFHPALMNVEQAESANLITATSAASVNLVTKGSRHAAVVSQLSSNRSEIS